MAQLPRRRSPSPCPRSSALNSPYSLRYLAFRLPSRMPCPALQGPFFINRCIINRLERNLTGYCGVQIEGTQETDAQEDWLSLAPANPVFWLQSVDQTR